MCKVSIVKGEQDEWNGAGKGQEGVKLHTVNLRGTGEECRLNAGWKENSG